MYLKLDIYLRAVQLEEGTLFAGEFTNRSTFKLIVYI